MDSEFTEKLVRTAAEAAEGKPYSDAAWAGPDRETRCTWCNTDPVEAAARYEGPHATWCVHFRASQRGGPKAALSKPGPGAVG